MWQEVSASEGLAMSAKLKAPFFEVSARTGSGVDEAFRTLAESIRATQEASVPESNHSQIKQLTRRASSFFGF